jgi:GNAT superfamily N-acetyltransferase
MPTILQLRRRLDVRPTITSVAGVNVRHYQNDADISAWLELRHLAFARQRIGVRSWTAEDFRSEFTARWWWTPQRMWLVEPSSSEFSIGNSSAPPLVGTVILALRGGEDQIEQVRAAVHWLMVHPHWRRQQIGSLLIAHLEAAAWDAGYREIWLETHAAWEAAVKFYESRGYVAS